MGKKSQSRKKEEEEKIKGEQHKLPVYPEIWKRIEGKNKLQKYKKQIDKYRPKSEKLKKEVEKDTEGKKSLEEYVFGKEGYVETRKARELLKEENKLQKIKERISKEIKKKREKGEISTEKEAEEEFIERLKDYRKKIEMIEKDLNTTITWIGHPVAEEFKAGGEYGSEAAESTIRALEGKEEKRIDDQEKWKRKIEEKIDKNQEELKETKKELEEKIKELEADKKIKEEGKG